jgi:hypothetical protein
VDVWGRTTLSRKGRRGESEEGDNTDKHAQIMMRMVVVVVVVVVVMFLGAVYWH